MIHPYSVKFHCQYWESLGDAGLKDMLADSETYAPATAKSMLSRKQYNRAIRALMLVITDILLLCKLREITGR